MIICKKLYFLIIENIKDIDLRKIKKRKNLVLFIELTIKSIKLKI